MHVKTFLPKDAALTKIGGPGKRFWVDGKNFPLTDAYVKKRVKHFKLGSYDNMMVGHWRMEVTPAEAKTDDVFLHLIEVGEKSELASMTQCNMTESDTEWVITINTPKKVTVKLSKTDPTVGHISIAVDDTVLIDQDFKKDIQAQSGLARKK